MTMLFAWLVLAVAFTAVAGFVASAAHPFEDDGPPSVPDAGDEPRPVEPTSAGRR